jgi:predicted Zn-dependent protease with MMP-like domain
MLGKIKKLEKLAVDEVETVLAALPAPLTGPARQVPVLFERLPDPELQKSGIEADTLGLFTGPELAHEGDEPMPPQIILFLENLWDEAEGDELAFRNEVRITYLHELGHYLGLNEEDLFKRGLE